MKKKSLSKSFMRSLIWYLVVGTLSIVFVLPFIWMLCTAFKTAPQCAAYPPTFIPRPFTLRAFKEVFEISPILKRLGADVIIGTDMDPKTGEIRGKNCKGAEKVERIRKEADGYIFRNAYTDNPESDAPLLSLAENKFLIKNGEIIPL